MGCYEYGPWPLRAKILHTGMLPYLQTSNSVEAGKGKDQYDWSPFIS
jgi:hypothetical protein